MSSRNLNLVTGMLSACLAAVSQAAEVSGANSKGGELKPAPRAASYPPQNSPDAAKRNFVKARIPAGFTADVWASEPLLANPVAFCFDPLGRMFVAETHRLRTSTLDIRHYYWMIEDDLACRNQDDWLASIKRNFPKDWRDLEKESEVIRLVEDSNGDGKADKSSVYADGFNSALDGVASGVLWHNDALFLANIPALWRLSGKEKAEKREEILRGFGVRFSYTGHDFHGLIMGPDGRLYFSIGDRGASIKTKEGTTIELPDEGAVFRCEPDGSHLELVMRGLRNPQELAFDDYGNLFTGDNDSDQGDRERWVAVIEGADAGWRVGYQHHPLGNEFNPWLVERMWEPRDTALEVKSSTLDVKSSGDANAKQQTSNVERLTSKSSQPAYILSPIANLPDGPSGLVHYPGTGLPAEYAGSFFLAGYKGSTAKSQVSTFKCEPDGAGFKLTGLRTFMDNVQATDVDFGPDSRFYVSAWDEGWERTDQGRIFRLSHDAARKEQAAQIAEVQKLLAEGFAQRSSEELVKLLAHADQRIRLGAQWALAGKEEGAKYLFNAIKSGVEGPRKDSSRLHGIWGFAQYATRKLRERDSKATEPQPPFQMSEAFAEFFSDPESEVRAQIVRIQGEFPRKLGTEAHALVVMKLSDPSDRVRFFAAMVLARKGENDDLAATSAIIDLLRENADRNHYLRHAGVMALAKCADDAALAAAAKDDSRSVRLAALLATTRRWTWPVAPANPAPASDAARAALVADSLYDKDPAIAVEAARLINDAPIPAAMPALAAMLGKPGTADAVNPPRKTGALVPDAAQRADGKLAGVEASNASATTGSATKTERAPAGAQERTAADSGTPSAARPAGAGDPVVSPPANFPRASNSPASAAADATQGDKSVAPPSDRMFLARVLNANFRLGKAEHAQAIADFVAKPGDEPLRIAALTMLEKWPAPPARDFITGTFRPLPKDDARATSAVAALGSAAERLLGDKSERIATAACVAISANKVTAAAPHLLALVQNTKAPAKARIAALDALAKLESPQLDPALAAAGNDANAALKTAASKLIGAHKPDVAAEQLIAAWGSASPAEKQDIAAALGATKSAKAGEFLARLVSGIANEPGEAQLEILEAAAKHNNLKAALATFQKSLDTLPPDKQAMERFRPALVGGDALTGEKLFKEHAVAACLRCHKIGTSGGDAGPELTTFAANHDRAAILESIIAPNAKIAEGFQMVILTLKDGNVLAGALKKETATDLILQNPGEEPKTVKKSDVKQHDNAPSGMLPNLGDLLTPREIRDIVEYVSTLR